MVANPCKPNVSAKKTALNISNQIQTTLGDADSSCFCECVCKHVAIAGCFICWHAAERACIRIFNREFFATLSYVFSFFSQAFNQLLDHLTAYKDILTDVKREYETCINAIGRGQKQSQFLKNKIKFLSSVPVATAGYQRRKQDLQAKYASLDDSLYIFVL